MDQKNIVVLGGGYAGLNFISKFKKNLPSTHRIVLVDEQDFFYHKIGVLRAVGGENISDRVLVPYDKLFSSPNIGIVVHASATEIKPHSVIISKPHSNFGSEIPFEYLLIATGSAWTDPVNLHATSRKDAIELLAKQRSRVESAKDIVIVGAGAVGIELSSEIKAAHPSINVHVIHKDRLPLSNVYPDSFRQQIKTRLVKNGINLLLNETVDLTTSEKSNTTLLSGKTLSSDITFFTIGAKPQGDIIKTLDESLYNPVTNSIRVNPTLQLSNSSYPHIFAAGDVADTNEVKMAFKAGLHAPIVATNITNLIQNREAKATYSTPSWQALCLPMGPKDGLTYMSFFGGITFGAWVTRFLKGKTLGVEMTEKLMK